MNRTAEICDDIERDATISGVVALNDYELMSLHEQVCCLWQGKHTRILEFVLHAIDRELERRRNPEGTEAEWLLRLPLSDLRDVGQSLSYLRVLAYSDLTPRQGQFVDELFEHAVSICGEATRIFAPDILHPWRK